MDKDRQYKDGFAKKVAIYISAAFSKSETKIIGRKVYDDDGKLLTIQVYVGTLINDSRKNARILTSLSRLSDKLDAKIRIYPYNSMLCVEIIVHRKKKQKRIPKDSKMIPWNNQTNI